jgi:hypothetical protein
MKETVLKLKLKRSEDRGGTFYLTTFANNKAVVVDSWERPELFRELLKFARECENGELEAGVLNSRHI